MNHYQTPTDYDGMEFSTSAIKRVGILQKENESLRQELAQMRINLIQQKQQHKEDIAKLQQQLREAQGSNNTTNNNDSSSSPPKRPPGIITFDTRKNNSTSGITKARRERVKVSFSLMSVKHAMQRLRNAVQELRTGVDADFIDAARMIEVKKKNIDDRIAVERPLVHKIHEAICDLARQGGNQKAETLQHLFSATSWGHTRISLTQAAPDIVKELEALVVVAEQQRRAKEILEVAAIHKERSLERANKAVLEMATTARNVVATFAQMARDIHQMAQHQAQEKAAITGDTTNTFKSILVTRALTIPDLEKFLPSTSSTKSGVAKSSELSLKQIEKFARQLQDSAFAATTLLQSATQAVLEPESIVVNNTSASPQRKTSPPPSTSGTNNNNNNSKRRKSIKFEDEVTSTNDDDQDQDQTTKNDTNNNNNHDDSKASPSLVKILRKRWVKSVFERAMLRMRFKNLLSSIHDDFVLNNIVYEFENQQQNNNKKRKQQGDLESSDKNNNINTTGATKWTSAFVKPTAPVTSASVNKKDGSKNPSSLVGGGGEWSTEDERRLKLHEKRHKTRIMQLLDPQHQIIPESELTEESKQQDKKVRELRSTIHRKLVDLSTTLDEGNHNTDQTYKIAKKQFAPSHFLKPTVTTSRRALPPPSGLLGKMSPLTGYVETAEMTTNNNKNNLLDNGGWRRGAKSDYYHQQPNTKSKHNDITEGMRSRSPKWFQPMTMTTTTSNNSKMVPQPPSSSTQNKFANVTTKDTLKEFFVLHDM